MSTHTPTPELFRKMDDIDRRGQDTPEIRNRKWGSRT
jgi:hypothetical protein